MNSERKVKGSGFIELVNVIRMFKQEPWEQYLTPEDMEIVNSSFLPGKWYPVEVTDRMTAAVFKLVVKGNMDLVTQFAKSTIKDYLEGPYRPFLDKQDPMAAVEKYIQLRNSLYSFAATIVEKLGERSVKITISDMGQVTEEIETFMAFVSVQFKELVTSNGGKDVKIESTRIDDMGNTSIQFLVSWS